MNPTSRQVSAERVAGRERPSPGRALADVEESGLPACVIADGLGAAAAREYARGGEGARNQALAALLDHQHGCRVCRARAAYIEAYGPGGTGPSLRMRVLGRMGLLIQRRPRLLLGATPARGEYRRFSFFMGALLSGCVVVAVGVSTLLAMLWGELDGAVLREHGILLAALIPTYFAGCWLAGAAWDATRGIRHRLAGYALRGAATAAAVYGSIVLAVPLLPAPDEPLPPAGVHAAFVVVSAILGALVGVGKWVRDRVKGDIPEPARE
jgi:hypothetical protein